MRTCVTAFVFGSYTRYIPYYIYSVLRSYPDYFVKIFIHGALSPQEAKSLRLLRREFSNFEVVENYLSNIQIKDKTLLRWLMPEEEFESFDCIYYGDVDFLIVPEDPSLLDGHIAHCARRGLPFSNEVRTSQRIASKGRYRLTGLHFVSRAEYFEVMTPILASYRDLPERLDEMDGRWLDEEFLYHLVSQGFDVIYSSPEEYYLPVHGFHLGAARTAGGLADLIANLRSENNKHLDFELTTESIRSYFDDPLFRRLLRTVHEPGIELLPDALGFAYRDPLLVLAKSTRSASSALSRAVEFSKRLAVWGLRALHLKPPAPESERA